MVIQNLWKSCKLFGSYWLWEPTANIQPNDEMLQIEQYWNPNVTLAEFKNITVPEIRNGK